MFILRNILLQVAYKNMILHVHAAMRVIEQCDQGEIYRLATLDNCHEVVAGIKPIF